MADSTAATTLLNELLSSGRITKFEFDRLNAVCQQLPAEDDSQIQGNVTLRTPDRKRIETVSRVLNTPELLEHILVQMLTSDLLLRAQLACKTFRDAIDSSVRIRRLLHREPDFNRTRVELLPFKLCGQTALPGPSLMYKNPPQAKVVVATYMVNWRLDQAEEITSSDMDGIKIGDVLEAVVKLQERAQSKDDEGDIMVFALS
ncbi:hypothetical protein LTR37_002607 [Vermiconidia calcicola]|uniref:Uncharacterized protein n=1 Tax=Vermiconidia calcicola TaxID=1690605 RepID=A0ACC3NTZ5_9PEZI|nr:hypothetical protein LTR37_002607 [Vermiconidia calcicola]